MSVPVQRYTTTTIVRWRKTGRRWNMENETVSCVSREVSVECRALRGEHASSFHWFSVSNASSYSGRRRTDKYNFFIEINVNLIDKKSWRIIGLNKQSHTTHSLHRRFFC